jgi:hypothetical protein
MFAAGQQRPLQLIPFGAIPCLLSVWQQERDG